LTGIITNEKKNIVTKIMQGKSDHGHLLRTNRSPSQMARNYEMEKKERKKKRKKGAYARGLTKRAP